MTLLKKNYDTIYLKQKLKFFNMTLKDVRGHLFYKKTTKYKINWNAESKSKYQKIVKDFLFPIWKNHIVFEEFPVYGTRLTVDIFNATKNIVVEVQGEGHSKFIPFFHKNRFEYLSQLKRDDKKLSFCKINNLKLLEIFPNDIKELSKGETTIEKLLETIGE